MGTMINRRRACGGEKDRLTLIHHWEAADWSGTGGWTDSVGGRVASVFGTPVKETIDNKAFIRGNNSNYFRFDANAQDAGLLLGDEFRIEVEAIIENPIGTSASFIVDFGSLNASSHAFAIAFDNANGYYNFNTKLTGNESNNTWAVDNTPATSPYGVLKTVVFGIERVGDGNVDYSIVDSNRVTCANILTREQAMFNRNFHRAFVFFFTGILSSYDNAADKHIKSIKIFKLIE